MNNESETSFLSPILSSLTAIATILATLSPLFSPNNFIRDLFIDQNAVLYASVVSATCVIAVFWFVTSIQSFSLFPPNEQSLGKRKKNFLLSFIIFSCLFYSIKLTTKIGLIDLNLGAIFQFLFYIFSFIALSTLFALLFRDAYQQNKYETIERQKDILIRRTLERIGLLQVDFQISKIEFYAQGMIVGKLVEFKIRGDDYLAIFNNDYNSIIKIEKKI